ncbi:hypothetical protein METBIDRAFT_77647 [Metschnikowia bicuspidata var. bicuspidata NRRL YB-4993]|uniref:F-box domain-containing protein n=1 Tax=Metschnikowia bicuspidata var. bicuspidata NRRL YB-4993 TaxID=869754 RepID=A0A1A0HDV4_9ASCO|nr:hypothetical protein METBIDRAFT_77647 [Metschnikowia bicuspidata var. bicuspidata NRRL YB-4993]OBA22186.1 hypothetical protein METBIDRAFT_77647 [Metschnikowia bicuspidata var. bicuspidata NRRL YB-4993]
MAQVLWNTDIDVYNEKVIPLSVARSISRYLEIPDLLQFSLVSKNAYKAVRDPALWVLKLRMMGVWDDGIEILNDEISDCNLEHLLNPLLCLSRIYKHPKLARFQMLKIRTCLKQYYNDLQQNVAYNHLKVFTNYHSPQDQARLLSNLLKYNSVDASGSSKNFVRQKITDILEIFENALLRELEIHYDIQDFAKTREFVGILIQLKNDQTLIDFFLQKTCFDNENIRFLNIDQFKVHDFFEATNLVQNDSERSEVEIQETSSVNEARVLEFIIELASVFNDLACVIDRIFPQDVPMMYKISEEIITNQLQDALSALTISAKRKGVYLEFIPMMYTHLTNTLVDNLVPCDNIGESYHVLIRQLVDVTYDSYVSEYMNEEKQVFKELCAARIKDWKRSLDEREAQTSEKILKHVRVQSKNDFLSNFKKAFTINGNTEELAIETSKDDVVNYSKGQANAKILAENIKSLNKVFSPELAFDVLKEARNSLERLCQFQEFSINAILLEIHSVMQEQFMETLECLGTEHLKVGFEKLLKYLKEYDPKGLTSEDTSLHGSAIGTLVIFFELIQTADMIVQMLDIFYKEEMISKGIIKNENSVLNPSLQSKKKLEGDVDKFVADGLNIGIEVLFQEIESVYLSALKISDYNPPSREIGDSPTTAARKVVMILEDNIDLLVGSADKSIIEVFQQEVCERFFQAIVKLLKRSTISVEGAVTLLFDLNLYYDFILRHVSSNKKMIYPLFQALKKVGTIYLIGGEDARAIGQIVSDLSKFNGIFSQEEIYEFVQRRQDWPLIKKHVEKVMYGLSLIDCTLM